MTPYRRRSSSDFFASNDGTPIACAKQRTFVSFRLSASQPLLTLASGEDIPKLSGMVLEGDEIVFEPDRERLPSIRLWNQM